MSIEPGDIRVRMVDAHTVQLSYLGPDWAEVSMPWLASDIGKILAHLHDPTTLADALRDKAIAVRLAVAKLAKTSPNVVPAGAAIDAKEHYKQSTVIEYGTSFQYATDIPLIFVCTPFQLLDLLSDKSLHLHRGRSSILVSANRSVLIGPVLETERYCPLCMRNLAAGTFSAFTEPTSSQQTYAQLGLLLGQILDRDPRDAVAVTSSGIEVHSYAPFIGCERCCGSTST